MATQELSMPSQALGRLCNDVHKATQQLLAISILEQKQDIPPSMQPFVRHCHRRSMCFASWRRYGDCVDMHAGVENYLIIKINKVPSVGSDRLLPFTLVMIPVSSRPHCNSIGMLDLNSVAIGVSPAYNMRIEQKPSRPDNLCCLSELQIYPFAVPRRRV